MSERWLDTPLTQQTWVWANSGRWWRTRKLGALQSMGSQGQTWLRDLAKTTLSFQITKNNKHRVPHLIFFLPNLHLSFFSIIFSINNKYLMSEYCMHCMILVLIWSEDPVLESEFYNGENVVLSIPEPIQTQRHVPHLILITVCVVES